MPVAQPLGQSACESQALAARFLEERLEPGLDLDEPLLCCPCYLHSESASRCSASPVHAAGQSQAADRHSVRPARAEEQWQAAVPREQLHCRNHCGGLTPPVEFSPHFHC